MQPPETEPITVPSSQMARVAPTGRGLEPQVLMTVISSQRRPEAIQAALVFNTSRSIESMIGIYYGSLKLAGTAMNNPKEDDGSPKFGRLLVVLILAVLFCAGLTWLMGTVFPNFP